MNAAERAERDQKALELFLAGSNYREIGAQFELTPRRVEDIVKRELAAAAKRRLVLTDDALAIHLERYERLYKVQWEKALNGDQRAAELCERMLARQARLFDVGDHGGGTPPLPAPTPTGPIAGDEQDAPTDELAQLRAARSGA